MAVSRGTVLDLTDVTRRICAGRRRIPGARSMLVALTGIDGSGKGHVAARLLAELRARGLRAAGICVDGWLSLPSVRFAEIDPAGHFYANAIRFDEMFSQLVLPLRDAGSVRVEADFAEETATEYRRHTYDFSRIDVIVLEGIFLLKRRYVPHYDLSVWIECSFETALERAIERAQEGLSAEETVRAYRTIYFPAQELHFLRDEPRVVADAIVRNDARLGQ